MNYRRVCLSGGGGQILKGEGRNDKHSKYIPLVILATILKSRLKSRFDLPASEANKYVMKLRDENGGKVGFNLSTELFTGTI